MAIVLNGTTGITNDSGYTGDGVSFADSTPANTLVTTSDGNVGIGTSSPASRLHVVTTSGVAATLEKATGAALQFVNSGGNGYQIDDSSGSMRWLSGGSTERMRIDSSGNLLVGSTTTQNGNKLYIQSSNFMVGINGTNATGEMIRFYSNGSTAGTIAYTATTVAYNTSSDYRLKHDIQPMTGALAKVAALKPVTYKWNADDSQSQGFIAHELQEVVPECVTGEKDAVDAEGNPQYQGIDTSFLVATLTAAIQEQQAIITALTARVEALEGAQA